MNEGTVQPKRCFFIGPIGETGSIERRTTDNLLQHVLRVALPAPEFEVAAAHEISDGGSITGQIIDHLLDDDLVVADLTGNNPNVMYELAIRNASSKPVIVIAQVGTRLPFDFAQERTHFYVDDMGGAATLVKVIAAVANGTQKPWDNPIHRAIKLKAPQGSADEVIATRLETIESAVTRISRHLSSLAFETERIKTPSLQDDGTGTARITPRRYESMAGRVDLAGPIDPQSLGEFAASILFPTGEVSAADMARYRVNPDVKHQPGSLGDMLQRGVLKPAPDDKKK